MRLVMPSARPGQGEQERPRAGGYPPGTAAVPLAAPCLPSSPSGVPLTRQRPPAGDKLPALTRKATAPSRMRFTCVTHGSGRREG